MKKISKCLAAAFLANNLFLPSAYADGAEKDFFIPIDTRVCVVPDKSEENSKPWNGFVASVAFRTTLDKKVKADHYRVHDGTGVEVDYIPAAHVYPGYCV